MRRSDYGDPAAALERKQVGSCAGCRYDGELFGRPACGIGRRHGRKCKRYEERKPMTLEERLENWGRVVRSPMCSPGYSDEWAKWYYQIRGFVPDAEDQYRASQPPVGRDERDGWDVERAWRAMSNPVNKDLLCCVYVYRLLLSDLRKYMWERHRSRIRVHTFSFALSNAHREIQRELVRLPPRPIVEKTACKPGETVL